MLDDRGQLGGEVLRVGRVVLERVGDPEAAAEVELGQLDAQLVADPALEREHPTGRDLEAGGVEDLRADVAVQPEELGSPSPSWTRRTAARASPALMEKPNFWSSWAVAMYSWVCASTPAVTRTMTGATRPSSAVSRSSRSISSKESSTMRPDPGLERGAQLGGRLVVAVEADPGRVGARPQRDRELARRSRRRGPAPPRPPSGRPWCTGTPCRRRRRRRRRRPRGTRAPGRGSPPRPGRTPACRPRPPGRGRRPRRRGGRRRASRRAGPQVRHQRVGVDRLAQPGRPAHVDVGVQRARLVGPHARVREVVGRRGTGGTPAQGIGGRRAPRRRYQRSDGPVGSCTLSRARWAPVAQGIEHRPPEAGA